MKYSPTQEKYVHRSCTDHCSTSGSSVSLICHCAIAHSNRTLFPHSFFFFQGHYVAFDPCGSILKLHSLDASLLVFCSTVVHAEKPIATTLSVIMSVRPSACLFICTLKSFNSETTITIETKTGTVTECHETSQ